MAGPDSRSSAGEALGGCPSVAERIARRISEHGPIPVSEYVDACLYDPDGGFYMRGGRAGGRSGHFLTAPEVGPLFGAVLARALDAWWAELGEPAPFTVIDWGAGPGTLARSVLAAEPRCVSAGALRWVAVEVSPSQRALHPDHPLVTSTESVHDIVPHGAGAGVVVANELLDNMPFDMVRRTADGWEEMRVCLGDTVSGHEVASRGVQSGCRFALTAAPAPSALVHGLPDVVVGTCVPVQHGARRWVAEARGLLEAGWIVAFDYGADTAVLAERSTASDDPQAGPGWLRTHRRHDAGAGWLAAPGSCDVTTDLALDQVQGDYLADVCSQADFLRSHGIDELVAEGRATWAERAGIADLEAFRARSRQAEAEALLDPEGMGAFNVLAWTVG